MVRTVRAQVASRDGYCRFLGKAMGPCKGPSQWCHLRGHTRAETRRQDPAVRHTTGGTVMGCELHHDHLDGRRHPPIGVTALSSAGADGRLRFDCDNVTYVEVTE